ncbi:MAG: hypothetical protein ACJAXB_002905 [Candidatus Endobugula sp.]|jgi:hypothetical protein
MQWANYLCLKVNEPLKKRMLIVWAEVIKNMKMIVVQY